jgi:23S rRNA (pseudouridine1915-N3)-methyltransferase
MRITVLSVGKKHDADLAPAIDDYSVRVNRSAKLTWEFIVPSGYDGDKARADESTSLLARCKPSDTVWLLDETGTQISSPELAGRLEKAQNASTEQLTIVIGGAYGVDAAMDARADFVWSLSKLVFPHQLVRLLLAEQLYRAYEINRGSGYHHS